MTTKATMVLLWMLLGVIIVGSILAYPFLPEQIASHWNTAGETDDYTNKLGAAIFLPLLMLGSLLAYVVIPKIDPLRQNVESFRPAYNNFWVFLFLFFTYLWLLTLAWNLGYRFDFVSALLPAIAAFWFFLGTLLEKSKRNWFIGIRTPWTLSSDAVWEKTHRLGGLLFKIAALISLAGLFVPNNYLILTTVIPAVAIAIITAGYSYVQYYKTSSPT